MLLLNTPLTKKSTHNFSILYVLYILSRYPLILSTVLYQQIFDLSSDPSSQSSAPSLKSLKMNKCGTKSLNISYHSPLLVLTTISTVLYQQIFDLSSDPSSQSSAPSLKSLKMNKCGTKSLNILYNSPLLVLSTISTVLYQQIFDLSSDPSSQSSAPSLKSLKMNKCGTKLLNILYNSPLRVLSTISTVLYQQIFDLSSDPSSQSFDPSLKSLKMNKCGTKSLNKLYNSPLLVLSTISTVQYHHIFDLSSDPSSQSSAPSLKSLKMNKCGTKLLNILYNSPLRVLSTISTVLYQQIFDLSSDPSSQSFDPSLKSLKMNKCGTKSLNTLYVSPLRVLSTISTVQYHHIFDLSSDPSSQSSDPSLKSLKMG